MTIPTAPVVPVNLPAEFHFGEARYDDNAPPVQNEHQIIALRGVTRLSDNDFRRSTTESPVRMSITSLDVLERFDGTFAGLGFNTIFRPHSSKTPTELPNPIEGGSSNILQLSLTSETMVFSDELGDIPNRGLKEQADIVLNGRSYTQTISDTTMDECPKIVIHFEPGLWMRVPASETMPELKASFCRMASIPHGTVINAQTFKQVQDFHGPPTIPAVSITPFDISSGEERRFASQTLLDNHTHRLPQDLQRHNEAGTITQEILDNPNAILKHVNASKDIISHSTFTVLTKPGHLHLGGGTRDIGFLVGTDFGAEIASTHHGSGNAHAARVSAQYWISRVRAKVHVKPGKEEASPGKDPKNPRDVVPEFKVDTEFREETTLTVEYNQIQYSQHVSLDFNKLTWPHITVATLVPIGKRLSEAIV